eukprot:CAMPEP_0116999244 /NCGR_PEP_ID=MMETSP0472-20121206/2025_1 /TAXON_ID=693140 ORGANISM="Tiarina fusus, Strain LIS" /NCGR_SAMPLE_ID=MMETSP0472 /ASSEMBLY_ACC=CAM_ASM_000603 /LENGTH=715 /DNA_ID=CAMNT_0004698621 /DNA_START=356 /DNA_END=2501 /DNA_ORIENTATION=-
MVSISTKINRIIEETKAEAPKRTTLSFDIFSAINGGKIDRVSEFIEKDPKLLLKGNDEGDLPIHYAIVKNQPEIAKMILTQNGAVVSASNGSGLIPLEIAIIQNDRPMVELLSSFTKAEFVDLKYVLHCDEDIRQFLLEKYGDRVNEPCPDRDRIKNKTKQTPMHKVCTQGRNDVLVSLLGAQGNPNVKDANGNTPLHCAALHNNPNCVRTLVAGGALLDEPNLLGDTPLLTAASVSSHETVRTLLDAGADIEITNNKSESPVLLAVARENEPEKGDILDTLIHDEGDVNQQDDFGYTPLILATEKQDKNSIQRLLQVENIDVDAATEDGFTALMFSVINDDVETTEKLFAHGVDPEMTTLDDKTACHYATSAPMAGSLVKNGADVNAKDNNGQTPIFTFVQNSLSEVALEAISLGADIGVVDNSENTILHEAAVHGDAAVTKNESILQKKNPDTISNFDDTNSFINHPNNQGRTVMHQVCSNAEPGTKETFDILSQNGASLSCADENGNFPIHFAAQTDNPNLVSCLQNNPELVNAQNRDLNTPLHLAADAGHGNAVDNMIHLDQVDFELKNSDGKVASEATGDAAISQQIALQRMVQQYDAKDGEVVFGLKWFDWNDLDIHLICACGEEICFSHRFCLHCELDIDMNVNGSERITDESNSEQAVEHVAFENFPPNGKFQVIINLFSIFEEGETCEYSLFMVQKDPVTRELSDL